MFKSYLIIDRYDLSDLQLRLSLFYYFKKLQVYYFTVFTTLILDTLIKFMYKW